MSETIVKEKWILLGAGRGLGLSFSSLVKRCYPEIELFIASRSINGFDFSKTDLFEFYAEKIVEFDADRVFYFAGGGPYGPFSKFEWKDHLWSLNVTFGFPAYLLNYLGKNNPKIRQMIFIGSAIAESQPDPHAGMYCASKHALKGLVESLKKEGYPIALTLFSPGYMNTAMLPKAAWPREKSRVDEPEAVAQQLLQLVINTASS
ncbi:MAG: SDR family oxidoreductase [Bdellovibrionaceae bacterium]|nr:SDR family oxidoreductase [Pseudobdellovibrionaceae bacterium]